jgi:hypothetical protein
VTQAVIDRIAAIQSGGNDAFRSVTLLADPDKRRSLPRLRSAAAPAAGVVYTGRLRAGADDGLPSEPKLSVFITASNLRGGDDPQTGDISKIGAFNLLSLVLLDLDGAIVDSDRRLVAVDEQLIEADERVAVYEQRYVVERVNNVAPPTWNGSTLTGASSVVDVEIGDVTTASSEFAFPGVDGVFQHHLGVRSRDILWRGRLQSDDDAALNAIETAIESAVAAAASADLVDAFGRTFTECVPRRFSRRGKRRRHPISGSAVQPFELVFTQLNP